MPRSEQYEIRVQTDKRWQIQSVVKTEKEALTRAETLLESGKFEAVEVVQERVGASGLSSEKVVFSKTSDRKVEKKINIVPIDDAPLCETVEQVYDADSRRAIGRLLREYLEQVMLTPTELLHTHRALVKLNDAESLLPTAIDRVAKLQARRANVFAKERAQVLYKFFEEVVDRARRTEIIDMKQMTFAKLVAAVDAGVPAQGRRQAVMTALTRKLSEAMIWDGKLEILINLVEEESLTPWASALLDSVIAELLDMPSVLRELLGKQPDLLNVLKVLIGLSRGTYEPQRWDSPNVQALARLTKAKPMPASRKALGEWVAREMAGRKPLTRGNARDEEKAQRELLQLIVDGHEFVGGRETLNAFTRRFARHPESGTEIRPAEETLGTLLDTLESLVPPVYKLHAQIRCLLDVSRTDFGRDSLEQITARLTALVGRVTEIYDLTYYRLPLKRRMADVATLQKIALECDLPGGINMELARKLDDVLCAFIDAERIIEKLDNPDDALSVRAIRLLQFCASGTLTEGNARKRASEAVLQYLRQPNFVERYTEGVTSPAQREEMIRQLHRLIAAAGVQM